MCFLRTWRLDFISRLISFCCHILERNPGWRKNEGKRWWCKRLKPPHSVVGVPWLFFGDWSKTGARLCCMDRDKGLTDEMLHCWCLVEVKHWFSRPKRVWRFISCYLVLFIKHPVLKMWFAPGSWAFERMGNFKLQCWWCKMTGHVQNPCTCNVSQSF